MNRHHKLRTTPVVVGLALAILSFVGVATDEAMAGSLPKDPCALLKPAEIQTLAPNAKIGNGVADAGAAPLGTGCTYSWGPRTPEWGESVVTVTVIDASKAWVGVSFDQLVEGLLAKVKVSGPKASEIHGIGDAGAFTFEAHSSNATAEALMKAKDVHLSVTYHAGDSLASKDKVVALLKAAAGRL